MQTGYVLVHDARLNWQNKKPQKFKGVADYAFDV